jgi:hypothetical protein
MWIHSAAPGNPLFDLAGALNLNISRKQNYNSGAIFTPGTSTRSNLLSYARVSMSWNQVVEGNVTCQRAAAAAAAASSTAVGAPEPPPVDAPLADVFRGWVAAEGFEREQLRQAELIMHTRWQVGGKKELCGWDRKPKL